MLKVIIRILLKALVIMYIFPLLPGISFHGNFYWACGLAAFFSFLLSFMELMSVFFASVLAASTFGLAILVIIPIRILFFWVLPTISLLIIAHYCPTLITIKHWIYAPIAAIILLAVGFLTRDRKN